MKRILGAIVALGLTASLAGPAAGQGRPRAAAPGVELPVAPPPNLCRIWYRGVPPERQPPPTDCRTARRQAAISGGLVIVGRAEAGGALRIGDWDERYRRDAEARDRREEERRRSDRDRDWRDGSWNDRDWRDDLDPWRP